MPCTSHRALSSWPSWTADSSTLLPHPSTTGLVACPGFLDMHVHVAGGGGEAGPSSRTPEARLSKLLLGGTTTVVGTTGTDSVSRSQARWPVGVLAAGAKVQQLSWPADPLHCSLLSQSVSLPKCAQSNALIQQSLYPPPAIPTSRRTWSQKCGR